MVKLPPFTGTMSNVTLVSGIVSVYDSNAAGAAAAAAACGGAAWGSGAPAIINPDIPANVAVTSRKTCRMCLIR